MSSDPFYISSAGTKMAMPENLNIFHLRFSLHRSLSLFRDHSIGISLYLALSISEFIFHFTHTWAPFQASCTHDWFVWTQLLLPMKIKRSLLPKQLTASQNRQFQCFVKWSKFVLEYQGRYSSKHVSKVVLIHPHQCILELTMTL